MESLLWLSTCPPFLFHVHTEFVSLFVSKRPGLVIKCGHELKSHHLSCFLSPCETECMIRGLQFSVFSILSV